MSRTRRCDVSDGILILMVLFVTAGIGSLAYVAGVEVGRGRDR